MKTRKGLKFSDLPQDVQDDIRSIGLEDKVDPNVVQEWLDQLEEDTASYVQAVVGEIRGAGKGGK